MTTLTKLGMEVIRLDASKRDKHAKKLLSGKADINKYMKGICYDAVAVTRYLCRSNDSRITPSMLLNKFALDWKPIFDFENGIMVMNTSEIRAGDAIGFYNISNRNVFHSAMAVGAARVRSINGGLLGNGWLVTADLDKVTKNIGGGIFEFDRTEINIFVSRL